MTVFVDTNVFIASTTAEPGKGVIARDFLNLDLEFTTSLLNLMELRSVLAKKKRIDQPAVEETIADIGARADVYAPDSSDWLRAYDLQRETLLYTVDALLLSLAEDLDADLVTFDTELLEHGAVNPASFTDTAAE